MQIIETVGTLRAVLNQARQQGQTIGLVPTMGALHAGHASLIKAAAAENDLVVVSVFVNPTQFGPNEDFAAYPRTLESDAKTAAAAGAAIVFAPTPNEIYPAGNATWVNVEGPLTQGLCGRSRPIHFRGVTTVVSRLFNIVRPTRAYFGQKDAQQVQVLKRMTADLFFDIELRIQPIVREADGLALSSRNAYLSQQERQAALVLSRSLQEAKRLVREGLRDTKTIEQAVAAFIKQEPLAEIDYVELVHPADLSHRETLTETALLALAVRIGKTRLIDNTFLEAPACF